MFEIKSPPSPKHTQVYVREHVHAIVTAASVSASDRSRVLIDDGRHIPPNDGGVAGQMQRPCTVRKAARMSPIWQSRLHACMHACITCTLSLQHNLNNAISREKTKQNNKSHSSACPCTGRAVRAPVPRVREVGALGIYNKTPATTELKKIDNSPARVAYFPPTSTLHSLQMWHCPSIKLALWMGDSTDSQTVSVV